MNRYICVDCISSSYLLVFGDDRVRDTREHMILQVVLVRHRARSGLFWDEKFYLQF